MVMLNIIAWWKMWANFLQIYIFSMAARLSIFTLLLCNLCVGEPPTSYSSLWKGYTILSEVRNKLFSSFSTAAVVSFRYRSGMESVRIPILWVSIHTSFIMYNFPLYTLCMYD